VIGLAVFVLSLPLRIAWQLGVRRTLILGCLLVLAVTAYGVADDLGLLGNPPTHARGRPDGQATPSRAATADIPPGYLRQYRSAVRRCSPLCGAVLGGPGGGRQTRERPRPRPAPRRPLRVEPLGGGGADAVRHRQGAGRQRLGPLRS
jgi:hypothetical protein